MPVDKSSEFEMSANNNSEVTEGALSQETNQTLIIPRRSNRKRRIFIPSTQTFAKKFKKTSSTSVSPVSAPTITTLPYVVIRKLLLYFDVDTLENLCETCSYFDQFISGRFITCLDFPLPLNFINEVATTCRLEKKPLLKVRCKKTDKMLFIPESSDYMFHSQLSLLSLDKVREFDFVPASLSMVGNSQWSVTSRNIKYEDFDLSLLRHVQSMGSLDHVTRLNILFNDSIWTQWHVALQSFPSLIELGITISEPSYMGIVHFINYIRRLKKLIAVSKAPVLKLCWVKSTSRRMGEKVLKNSFVEKLVVEGPCTVNLVPVMENLKAVEVKLDSSLNSCTYWRSKLDDRNLHRDGLCCVNIGKMFDKCPNLEKFMGMDVGSIPKTTFNKWSLVLKKKFYEKYLYQGGTKEFKAWARTRWFSKKQVIFSI